VSGPNVVKNVITLVEVVKFALMPNPVSKVKVGERVVVGDVVGDAVGGTVEDGVEKIVGDEVGETVGCDDALGDAD